MSTMSEQSEDGDNKFQSSNKASARLNKSRDRDVIQRGATATDQQKSTFQTKQTRFSPLLRKRNSDTKEKSKLTLKERFKLNFFSNNNNNNTKKLAKLNRAVSDNSSVSSMNMKINIREFPSFNFSPDEISCSEFVNTNSEFESEFHYLEEFRKELDRDYKPAYLCEPKARLATFSSLDISENFTMTQVEWKAYKKWTKLIFHHLPDLSVENPKKISLRMRIFLHFYNLEIPIANITESNIKTQSDWVMDGYEVMDIASFIQVPLNELYSPCWWCSPNAPEAPSSMVFGSANICHYYQTKVDANLSNTRMKYKRIKEELRKYIIENESITSIMGTDPFTQNIYIKLLIRWAISSKSKIPHKLRLNSCLVLARLAFPVETVVGLREKLLNSGVVFVILTYARRGEMSVSPHVELQQIEIDHFLDSGAVGKVHLGKWKGIDVAIKMCHGSSVAFVLSEFRFEVALMTMLSHPNILPCLAAKIVAPSPYFLVSPYQSKGALKTLLLDTYEEISVYRKVHIAYCIASAVKYLHKYKIIHRDIKSHNILVGDDWNNVYLTDFGTSRFIGRFDTSPLESNVGTNEYMAPELLKQPQDESIGLNYDFKVDVYSYGILLFEIITRSTPYEGIKSFQIPDLVLSGQRPTPPNSTSFADYKPKELVDLMKSCLLDNPKKRPSFADIKAKLTPLLRKLQKFENVKTSLITSNSVKINDRLRNNQLHHSNSNKVKNNDNITISIRSSSNIMSESKIRTKKKLSIAKRKKSSSFASSQEKEKDVLDSSDIFSDDTDDFMKEVNCIEEQLKGNSDLENEYNELSDDEIDTREQSPPQTMGLGFNLD